MSSIPDCIFKTMCFCLLFVFFSNHSQAQISNLYIEYSKNQGLSDNFINSIVEDSKGFIWITSNYGINRFDGKYFKTYLFSDYPVLKRNNFKCSAIDRNGNILFGSYDGVIVRYNIKTLEFEDVSIKKIYGTNYVSINGFYSCSHGNLYALTTSGIFKFDYKEDKFDNSEPLYSGTQHLRVHSLYIDNFNRYWMCTGMGLYVVDGAKIYNLQDIFEQVVISENVYLQNYNDSILFIGTASSGLWAINIANKSLNNTSIIKIKSPFDDVSSFYLDSSQRLYIGTLSAGMWYSENISDINNIEFKPKEENLKAITCIHIDHYKNIWLGTRGAGLLCYPAINYSKVIHSSTLGFPNTIVSSFEKDIYGNIWVGTDGNGIYILSPENNIISHLTAPNHLTSNGVLDIANGSNGQFWVGTWGGGITKIDVETKKSDFFATWNSDIPINNVKSVCYSKDKSVWVASHGEGLVNYNPDKNIWKKYSDISDTWINKVIEDSDNKIWLASIHNVWLITEDSVAKILSNTGNSPEHYPLFIHSIAVNNNDNVYAATNKGIYVIDGQDKKVSMPNYLPKGEYLSIKFDNKNRAWATSNIGIIDIDIDNKTYTLVSSDYEPYINYFTPRAIYVDSLYNIYLGTSDGFLFFNKDSVGEKSSIKTFDLADIYINSQKISRNSYLISENEKTLKLPYNQTNIRVDIDIVSNDNVVISYFLDGFDKSWNNIENDRKIIFNQLPPGKYTLNIIAHTINNERESKSVKLNLIILPPWWKTWWFYISSSLLIAVLIFVIIRIRLKKLNEYALKLGKKVSERTTDLIAANKTISERNKLLQVKQSMIEDKNLELIQTISTKDKLMSIIAHDLKSPMHSLTSLLGLLIQNHSKYDD